MFSEVMGEENQTPSSKPIFTGNWFIDAGVLGFVNLMEEVYGWDIEELNKEIEKNEKLVYYGYFPFAYLYKWIHNKAASNKDKKNKDKKNKKTISLQANFNSLPKELDRTLKNRNFQKGEDIFNFVWDTYIALDRSQLSPYWQQLPKSQHERLPVNDPFFTNFLFFHFGLNEQKQKSDFLDLIQSNYQRQQLQKIDKTINKLLPSAKDFANIGYTPFSSSSFKQYFKYPFVYLICFRYAFIHFNKIGNIMFYSNDLDLSYKIYKRLNAYKNRPNNKGEDLISFTWSEIFDILAQYKSMWSLENMYLISYKQLNDKKQQIIGVEYVGIPKLQAYIISDDKIRKNLNTTISIMIKEKDSESEQKVWLLKEFINGKPLFGLILENINLNLNKKNGLNIKTNPLKYSLIIEAEKSSLATASPYSVFSENLENYLEKYESLKERIKEEIRKSSRLRRFVNKISDDREAKRALARELFETIKAKDKNALLNILLKNLNKNKELATKMAFNRWLLKEIIDKIIDNDSTFEYYGLLLVVYLLGG